MNKLFISLSIMMGVVVLSSNYLVQFPINYFGLNEVLTYGAVRYPIAFLITDLANRSYGKFVARKIVYLGFLLGIGFTVFKNSSKLPILSTDLTPELLTESFKHLPVSSLVNFTFFKLGKNLLLVLLLAWLTLWPFIGILPVSSHFFDIITVPI